MVNFHKQKGHDCWNQGTIWTIIELEKEIIVLNYVSKFHKILIKIFNLESEHRF